MITYLTYVRVAYAVLGALPFVLVIYAGHAAAMLRIDRDYWRAIAKSNARHGFWLQSALDAWYFRRPRRAAADFPPPLTREEAEAIVSEIYEKHEAETRTWN